MKMDSPKSVEIQARALPSMDSGKVEHRIKDVRISLRSRIIVWLMRHILRPWLARKIRGGVESIGELQLWLASRVAKDTSGLEQEYVVLGQCPGHFLGSLTDTKKRVVMYIHGGAFILPAVPEAHVTFASRLCRDLDAVGFVPDYRLAPLNKFPAALDDCERGYRALLDAGFDPKRIVLAGESAGGNLLFGLLQRIRKHGWPMPACAVPISPATELGRLHGPPSRPLRAKQDPILPAAALARVDEMYAGDHDASDPELSPLYADCRGFPPLYLLASDNEVLLDDTVLFARRALTHGVDVKFEVWPILPHAFPLFAQFFPEVRQARKDIVAFAARHLG